MSGSTEERGVSSRVGRHVIIEQLGAGGMGIVYAAYDPKLDRKIAIKVLKAGNESEKASAALLREAKAMARVSHENVISVFDVGTDGGDVYIAMEFVQGQNLRTWLKAVERPRPWRETLRVFVPAGKGLAAAHEAGLVHGDFKPDNVLLSDRAEVRVMDFGLARPGELFTTNADSGLAGDSDALSTDVTKGTYGTPAYMAPEQFQNAPADERSDQFSYCVALYEALYGQRPFAGKTAAEIADNVIAGRVTPPPRGVQVPAWLGEVVLRGTRPRPDDRWPAMKDLLAALQSDPTRKRRLIAGGAVVGVLAAGTVAGLWTRSELLSRACDDAGHSIDAAWGDTQRTALADALVQSGTPSPEQVHEKTVPWLDAYAAAWTRSRTDICIAGRVDSSITTEEYEASRDCHDDLRADFETRVDMLLTADKALAQRAVQLAASLPRLETCVDARALLSRPRAPADPDTKQRVQATRRQLIATSAYGAAGKFEPGKQLAAEALAEAEAIGWPPLVAEAKLRLGDLVESAGDYDEAQKLLQEAALLAGKTHHDTVAADAAIQLAQVAGNRQAKAEVGELWGAFAAMYLERLGEQDGLRRAGLHAALGSVYTTAGRFEEAAAEIEQAMAVHERVLGENHPRVAATLNNLAVVLREQGKVVEAEAAHRRELALSIEALGADHVEVAFSHVNLGSVLHAEGKYAESEVEMRRALALLERAVGPDHPNTSAARANLGAVLFEQGEYDEALVHHRKALAAREEELGADHPETARSRNGIATVLQAQGHYAEALAEHRGALVVFEKTLGVDHPTVGASRNNIAGCLYSMNESEAAAEEHRRALAIFEKALGDDHEAVAQSRTNLADVLLDLGQPDEALALAEKAWERRQRGDVPAESEGLTAFAIARALWLTREDADSRARALAMGATAVEALTRAGAGYTTEAAAARTWVAEHEQDPAARASRSISPPPPPPAP